MTFEVGSLEWNDAVMCCEGTLLQAIFGLRKLGYTDKQIKGLLAILIKKFPEKEEES